MSKRRERLARQCKAEREAYLREFPYCMVCGGQSDGVHEISRGASRADSICVRETWLATCSTCNCVTLDDYGDWPIAKQLALKRMKDPLWYNRVLVNRIRGRADDAISVGDVAYFYLALVGENR